MQGIKFICLIKSIRYEFDYLRRKFQINQIIILVLTLFSLIVTSFGDTTSFFVGDSSPLPKHWNWLQNKTYVFILAIVFITIPSIALWINDFKRQLKDNVELSEIVEEVVFPKIEEDLNNLKADIEHKFKTNDDIRLSIFVPVRIRFLKWRLQMVCKTNNIPKKELEALFELDEGALGYTFLKTKKRNTEFIDFSANKIPPHAYVPLSRDNCMLINRGIKAVVVVSAFQNNSVAGLLAIDTDNLSNLNIMEDYNLHDNALDWIIARKKAVKWIWRMKNNV